MKLTSIRKFLSSTLCYYPCDKTYDHFVFSCYNGLFKLIFYNRLLGPVYCIIVTPVSSRSFSFDVRYLGSGRAQCFNTKQNFPFMCLKQTSLKMLKRSLEMFALKVYEKDLY